jgi:hypothetical protein
MQPAWLNTAQQKWFYGLTLGLILTLLIVLVQIMFYALLGGWDTYKLVELLLISWSICGLILASLFKSTNIAPTFKLSVAYVSYKELLRSLLYGFSSGLFAGLIFLILIGLGICRGISSDPKPINILLLGFCMGVPIGLFYRFLVS